jgi:hypothetical protein
MRLVRCSRWGGALPHSIAPAWSPIRAPHLAVWITDRCPNAIVVCRPARPAEATGKTARHIAGLFDHQPLRSTAVALSCCCQVMIQAASDSRSASMRTAPGGDEGARTPDIRLAKAALSQLSYIPVWAFEDSNLRPSPYQRDALTN